MENIDFRQIKPILRYNKYRDSHEYVIPCQVLEIGEKINNSAYNITIERLDLFSGKLVTVSAITFEKSIQIFNEMEINPPFISECKISKDLVYGTQYIVYGFFNTSGLINIINKDVETSESALNNMFMENYKELRAWLSL